MTPPPAQFDTFDQPQGSAEKAPRISRLDSIAKAVDWVIDPKLKDHD